MGEPLHPGSHPHPLLYPAGPPKKPNDLSIECYWDPYSATATKCFPSEGGRITVRVHQIITGPVAGAWVYRLSREDGWEPLRPAARFYSSPGRAMEAGEEELKQRKLI